MAIKIQGEWYCFRCWVVASGPFDHGKDTCPKWKPEVKDKFGFALNDIPSNVARYLQHDQMDFSVGSFDQGVKDYGDGKWQGN